MKYVYTNRSRILILFELLINKTPVYMHLNTKTIDIVLKNVLFDYTNTIKMN